MKTISLVERKYGVGMKGRYRCMKESQIVNYFMSLGWKPKWTLAERNDEVIARMERDELTKSEAEFAVDEDIQRDLEDWIQLTFHKGLIC